MTIDEAMTYCNDMYLSLMEQVDTVDTISILAGFDVEGCKRCAENYKQVQNWLLELKDVKVELIEAKRLLKLAVEDFAFVSENFINHMDSFCSMYNHMSGCVEGCPMSSFDDYGRCKWRYTDEALKLIGDESNGT